MIDTTITITLLIIWSVAIFRYAYIEGIIRGQDETREIYNKFFDEQIAEWKDISKMVEKDIESMLSNLFELSFDIFERVQWLQQKEGKGIDEKNN